MKSRGYLLIFIVLLTVVFPPAMAVTTYVDASPQLSAAISGTNEFSPGEDATITVLVLNSGTADIKQVMLGTIERDDVPTTAKMVTVGLDAGTAPVIIRSDPQNIGDIPSKGRASAKIVTKITTDATEGEYQLPLQISYTYLAASDNIAADVLQSQYRMKNVTIPLTIRIKPGVKIDVMAVTSNNLSVGTGGYITLTIRNLGSDDGKKATVKLLRNGRSPIIPDASSVFIGDFPRQENVTCRYKVSISTEAEEQTYPVDVAVTYENSEGETITTDRDTIGIPVSGKTTFSVTTETAPVVPGSDQVIIVEYKNTGNAPVYAAQARMTAVDPFTSSDDTAYLGDMAPGKAVTARYSVTTDKDAEAKVYYLDSEVRYRDALDNSQVSDTFKVPITVSQAPESSGLMPLIAILIVLALIGGAGYYYLGIRKNR